MVVELGALRHLIQEVVIEPLDHRFLNKDIPHFETRVPTAENIAIYIRDLLLNPLQELGLSLEKLRLYESPNNSCELYGTMGAIAGILRHRRKPSCFSCEVWPPESVILESCSRFQPECCVSPTRS